MGSERSFARLIRATARRIRLVRALRAALYGLTVGLIAQAVALLLWRHAMQTMFDRHCLLLAPGCAVLAGLLRLAWPVRALDAAKCIDGAGALADTMVAALQLQRRSDADDQPFVAALLRRADREAEQLMRVRIVPWRLRRALWPLLPALIIALVPMQRPAERSPRTIANTLVKPTGNASHTLAAQALRPDPRLQDIEQQLAARTIDRRQAILALMELEQAMAARQDDQPRDGFTASGSNEHLRSLKAIREQLRTNMTTNQRAELAERIADLRRQLAQLRARQAATNEQSRQLSQLDTRLAEAEQAMQKNRPEQAREALERAEQEAQQADDERRGEREQVARAREQLQRRDAVEGAQQRAESAAREESERRFDQRAQGSVEARSVPAPGGSQNDDGEPDLFQRKSRAPVRLEKHAAASQVADGESRSEVIITSAERGFATAPYRKVYADYRNHAEALMERDRLPPGYDFYVRRYFELIRPRAAGESSEPTH